MKFLPFTMLMMLLGSLNAQQLSPQFFDRVDAFLTSYVSEGTVDYASVQQAQATDKLVEEIGNASLEGADPATKQAFLINAYNVLVIHAIVQKYPIRSVLDQSGFFEQKKHLVAGERITLNTLEKKRLIKTYEDARFHFVLVCAAVDCPPITPFAYRPENLEDQLQARTRYALNDPLFIRVDNNSKEVQLSQIFEWYEQDFTKQVSSSLDFINQYRDTPIPSDYRQKFYQYNWSLNDKANHTGDQSEQNSSGANNAIRYVVSATIPKGRIETKIFNNLYTQATRNEDILSDRSTFFTTFITSLYGVNDRFNAGVEIRYREVLNAPFPSSPFQVFAGGDDMSQHRSGITTLGPKIRWAPVPKWQNFSIQSALWIPVQRDLEGTSSLPYIDWNGPGWWTQVFNDFSLGNNFSLFTEIDFLWEDIGGQSKGALNRISTPATVILSYFPHPQVTLYWLNGISPYWAPQLDYFAQTGAGAKYQLNRDLEFEVLYTLFTNAYLQENRGRASTVNLGLRFNLGKAR